MHQLPLSQRNARTALVLLGVLGFLIAVTIVSAMVLN